MAFVYSTIGSGIACGIPTVDCHIIGRCDTNDAASDDRFVVRLLAIAGVRREIDFEVRQFQGFEDLLTVFVSFDRDALDVDAGRGSVTMPERVLGLTEGP